jgi:hypothetical protein
MLVALEERCLKHMLDRMLPQDAAAVLEYALGTLPELRQRALELVARFTVEAVNSRGFLEAVPAVVEAILQLDRVSSTTELVLFQAVCLCVFIKNPKKIGKGSKFIANLQKKTFFLKNGLKRVKIY